MRQIADPTDPIRHNFALSVPSLNVEKGTTEGLAAALQETMMLPYLRQLGTRSVCSWTNWSFGILTTTE